MEGRVRLQQRRRLKQLQNCVAMMNNRKLEMHVDYGHEMELGRRRISWRRCCPSRRHCSATAPAVERRLGGPLHNTVAGERCGARGVFCTVRLLSSAVDHSTIAPQGMLHMHGTQHCCATVTGGGAQRGPIQCTKSKIERRCHSAASGGEPSRCGRDSCAEEVRLEQQAAIHLTSAHIVHSK